VEHSWEDRHCDCGCLTAVATKLTTVARKARGGGSVIPPPMTTQQALWTWLGTFLTLLVLSGIDHGLVTTTDQSLLIGPFGALMTLQYGLTAAPASQPRNAILGQIVSGAIAISFTYLPIPTWLQQALGPAFSVTAMCRLGIPHPPAGAHGESLSVNSATNQLECILVPSILMFYSPYSSTSLAKPSCMQQATTNGSCMELSSCVRLSVASWRPSSTTFLKRDSIQRIGVH
jgi:hypothetical protein